MPETQNNLLKTLTADDIQKMYIDGKILAYQRNMLMRDKAKQVTEELLGDKGYLGAIYSKMIDHAQHGWNNVIEAAQHETKPTITNKENVTENQAKDVIGDVKRELYYSMLASIGMIQVLTSPLSAFGEVNGKVAENTMLKFGASPGLAWMVGVIVDVGSGFVPTGMLAKAFAKSVRALPGVIAKTPENVLFTPEEMKVFEIIKRAMWKDGVPNAERVVNEAVESVTGNKLPAMSKDVEAAISDVKAALEKQIEPVSNYLSEATKIANGISKENAIKELPALAEKFGINLEDIANVIPAKQLMNPKQMYGYLKALEPHIEQLAQLAKDAINPKNNEAQAQFYQATFARHATELFTSVPGSAKINYNKSFMDMLLNWDPENVAKGDIAAAMKTFAIDIANIADNPIGLKKFVIDSQGGFLRLGTNWWPMAREAYQNLLLPFAWAPTFLGNSLAAGVSVLERATGSLFSIDRATGLVGREALYEVKGMMLSFGDISNAFAKAFDREGLGGAGRFDYLPGEIPGVLGSIIRSPGNAVLGMDNIFKVAFNRASLYTDSIRAGIHGGLKGEELGRFIQYRMMNPTEEMITRGNNIAMSNTFQDDLGPWAAKIKGIAQTGPAVLYFPFMKSMINLIKYSWNRTPGLQLASNSLYEDILAGGARADMAVGRLTLSSLWSNMIFEMSKDGVITGSGPVDPAQRKAWLATHEPYSIKIGSGWVPYTNMEPLSFSLGVISDFSQIIDQLDDPNASQLGMAVIYSTIHTFGNASFWHNTEDMMSVVQDFEKGGTKDRTLKLLMSPVTTVTSGGPIGTRVTRALDPFQRETRTFIDSWMSKVYPYSTDLPPKRDGYADVVKPPEVIGNSWFGMFSPLAPKFKPETNDRVKLEGDRLQAKLPVFPDNYGGNIADETSLDQPLPGDKTGIALSLKERDRWQQIYKNILRSPEFGIEKTLLDNPTYNDTEQTPIGMQRLLFQQYLNKAQHEAWNGLVLEDKNVAERLFKSKVENALPLVNIQTREGLIKDVQQGQRLFESLAPEQRNNLLKWGVLAPEEPVR